MHALAVSLPRRLRSRLEGAARERDQTFSELAREAVAALLDAVERRRLPEPLGVRARGGREERTSLRLPVDLRARVDRCAMRFGRPRCYVVRRALERWLEHASDVPIAARLFELPLRDLESAS